jgi:antagonist of KipI
VKTLVVESPGSFTTVQDLGREGFAPLGISASGAADPIALRLGNRLLGNRENSAALEMTLLGGTFRFPEGAVIAVTGSDFGGRQGELDIPLWRETRVQAGQPVHFGPTRSGARCYLCIRGGFSVKPFLGSASTHTLSQLGGFKGRALCKADVVPYGESNAAARNRTVDSSVLARIAPRKTFRVTAGPQHSGFRVATARQFFAQSYTVAEESNRMGIRLAGAAVLAAPKGEMITEGVSLGAIQVPPAGQPIILFVEQQTTGGYLKIANVITADLPSLGQLRPRDEIRFELVTVEMARSVLLEQEKLLASSEIILE